MQKQHCADKNMVTAVVDGEEVIVYCRSILSLDISTSVTWSHSNLLRSLEVMLFSLHTLAIIRLIHSEKETKAQQNCSPISGYTFPLERSRSSKPPSLSL